MVTEGLGIFIREKVNGCSNVREKFMANLGILLILI
ncbi:hypothetical protein LINPERHAP1_LOCUS32541 [Linum perenne]